MRSEKSKSAAAVMLFALASVSHAGHNEVPDFIKGDNIVCKGKDVYNGVSDDLLTAGLGKSGLQSATPPGFVDSINPTTAELRKRAIYMNYRALVDVATNGGYGSLYGPNIDTNGHDTLGEGKIAGEECLAFADDGSGDKNVTLMVQIPASFDPNNACIVTAPSSGSRGIYGAIGTAGEAGLKRGCAVAYTDKGSGMGTHDLQNDTVNLIDGTRAAAGTAGKSSNFTAKTTPSQLAAFNAATPNRFAFKHAHSQQNPEKDWGKNVLQSIELAFFLLNDRFGDKNKHGHVIRETITKHNTLVIASSVSNGGASSLRAAERDFAGLIDGVVVGEPQVQPLPLPFLSVKRGGVPVASHSKGLFDFGTIAILYQPCASLAADLSASPGIAFVNATRAANRCAALKAKGLLSGATLADQANESLAILKANGWEDESKELHPSHYAFATQAIAVTYANTYGRFSVLDNLCGYSFGATDASLFTPVAALPANVTKIFGDGNGIPPTGGINIINNNSVGGPLLDGVSVSPSTNQPDFNIDGALCLRDLFTGTDHNADRVRKGIRQAQTTAFLSGKPTIIVHGRSDALEPVNHTSRPFVALNKLVEGNSSELHYYEVTNAQHFDTFIDNAALPGYDTRFIPLHFYFNQAVDLMFKHLKNGTPLPPSQVVRTTPRSGTPGAAPLITPANVPPISDAPAAGDLIQVGAGSIDVPN